MTGEIELDNGPFHKVPKEIKSKGDDVYWCSKCQANTVYVNTCTICGIKGDIQLLRFSGRYRLILFLTLIPLLIALPLTTSYGNAAAAGLLRIKYPDQNATVAANNFIVVNGTSAASNSTHTHCNVQLQVNQHGYNPVKPNGASGTYTNWTATSREIMKVGHNEIEAQLLCFPPGMTATPNLIKHLVHNVTAQEQVRQPTPAPAGSGIPIINSTG